MNTTFRFRLARPKPPLRRSLGHSYAESATRRVSGRSKCMVLPTILSIQTARRSIFRLAALARLRLRPSILRHRQTLAARGPFRSRWVSLYRSIVGFWCQAHLRIRGSRCLMTRISRLRRPLRPAIVRCPRSPFPLESLRKDLQAPRPPREFGRTRFSKIGYRKA